MVIWRGARPMGQVGRWLLLLLEVDDIGGGLLAYTYSCRPGVNVQVVAARGPDMLPPYDATYRDLVAGLRITEPGHS